MSIAFAFGWFQFYSWCFLKAIYVYPTCVAITKHRYLILSVIYLWMIEELQDLLLASNPCFLFLTCKLAVVAQHSAKEMLNQICHCLAGLNMCISNGKQYIRGIENMIKI